MTDQKLKDAPDVINFLLGKGTLDGLSFGEFSDNGEKYKRRYWWRRALREAWNTRAHQPQSGEVISPCVSCAKESDTRTSDDAPMCWECMADHNAFGYTELAEKLKALFPTVDEETILCKGVEDIRAALTKPEHEAVDVKDQNMAVWQAMRNIIVGNKTDDKLIVAELHKLGYQIVRKKKEGP